MKVVLVTQFSVDRLMHFNTLLHYWNGPVSVAVYVTDSELSLLLQFLDNIIVNRTNVALHAIYKEGVSFNSISFSINFIFFIFIPHFSFLFHLQAYYPINYLRNIALNYSNDASFVFLTDVDFIPIPGHFFMK